MLNRVTALLMLLVASLSALSLGADEAFSFEAGSNGISVSAQSTSNSLAENATFESHHDQKDHSGECTHHDGACHQCHIGHCQFALFATSSLVAPIPQLQGITIPSEIKTSDFITSLLRPPRV